ncbi:MAG TPA: ABC transporter ATP-binding protein [Nocardia sp.]|uniref:ABC transporter ATP-binding protein n=1 Tax=Nocardia sp. TaxID=1821 RepID=UPI002B4B4B3D|nr:ABC transporter ATP-binding protein [Nocardia sp.]HLS77686.1 ABC transporter ATP-binding protein [Nocardia sp.]
MSSPDPLTVPEPGALLSLHEVTVDFDVPGRPPARVVDRVSLSLSAGRVLALVGESGSGKSTLARTVTGTLAENGRVAGGRVEFGGRRLDGLSDKRYRAIRGREIGYIPQDALLGLNPLLPVGVQAGEPLRAHGLADKAERRERVIELFGKVGLRNPAKIFRSYPHELSGGMCQRVLIAAAMSTGPKLLVADEPTTALDVTVQKRILDLLGELVSEQELAILLITHDLGVAAERADEIAVLKDGRLVRSGRAAEVIAAPGDAYTTALLNSSSFGFSGAAAAAERQRWRAEAGRAEEDAPVVVRAVDVRKTFPAQRGRDTVTAVAGASFEVRRGSTLGIVGESGSGKTTLVRLLAGLAAPESGTIEVAGRPVVHHRRGAGQAELYRTVQMVYQDPFASLNPRATVRAIIEEPLRGHRIGDAARRRERVDELLAVTGLPAGVADRYTAELSGGQRQRVAIARALAPDPDLVILDEPVSALDVTVQRQILDLLTSLQRELALTYVFISHDLGVIAEMSDRILVLHHGDVVEHGDAADILTAPQTDYVRELLASIPGASAATVSV